MMPRLQILELPTVELGEASETPFVLVIDQAPRSEPLFQSFREDMELNDSIAARVGARAVLVFEDTVEIPANEVPVGPDGYPVRMRVEADVTGFRDQVADAIVEAQDHARRVAADGGHRFGVPGYLDPQRCARCELDRQAWMFGRDRRTCAEVQAAKGGS